MPMEVPVIDLTSYLDCFNQSRGHDRDVPEQSRDQGRCEIELSVGKAITQALTTTGCCYLNNFGIANAQV
jgi:hypothetical protein